jgi:hypothetical protein
MKGFHTTLRRCAGLALIVLLSTGHAAETNFWPAYVRRAEPVSAQPDQITGLGPVFSKKESSTRKILSIRPFYTSFHDLESGDYSAHVLYPLVNWKREGDRKATQAVLLRESRAKERDPDDLVNFQLFPVLFIRDTPDPEASYFAVFPVGGELKDRFWRDRISFALWPLYVRTEKGDETRIHVPYPFVQTLHGPNSSGFGLWPIYGHFERDNDYERTWALWPLFYNLRDDLDKEVPYERFGVLPFYHRETGDGLKSETFIWPFFGYTREQEPRVVYSENRYLWPLFVQGRGEEKHVNRWMPFYTHESRPGREKNWYLWPFLNTETRVAEGVRTERDTFLYFLFRDERRIHADTTERLTTVWPLASAWDDGRGRKQVQFLDPFTVFFPSNRKVKENWSPLFALYRYDESAGSARHSLLWDMLVYERDLSAGARSFYLGPVFEWVQGSHWEFLKGLAGSSRPGGNGGLRLMWMNFNKD